MPHRVGMVRRLDLGRTGGSEFYGLPRHKLPMRERVRRLEQRMKYLESFLASPEERYDRLMAVKAVIRKHYAMGPRMLPMKCKREVVLWPRNIAIWLCENVMVLPRSMIGAHFGRRDYGTVVHAVKQVNNRMEVDPKFREEVALLEAKVRKLFNVEDV
jgi:chromosomal replication initiation ATPase DnaA